MLSKPPPCMPDVWDAASCANGLTSTGSGGWKRPWSIVPWKMNRLCGEPPCWPDVAAAAAAPAGGSVGSQGGRESAGGEKNGRCALPRRLEARLTWLGRALSSPLLMSSHSRPPRGATGVSHNQCPPLPLGNAAAAAAAGGAAGSLAPTPLPSPKLPNISVLISLSSCEAPPTAAAAAAVGPSAVVGWTGGNDGRGWNGEGDGVNRAADDVRRELSRARNCESPLARCLRMAEWPRCWGAVRAVALGASLQSVSVKMILTRDDMRRLPRSPRAGDTRGTDMTQYGDNAPVSRLVIR